MLPFEADANMESVYLRLLFSICFADNAIEAIDEFAFLEGEFLLGFIILCNLLGRERT